MVACVQQSCYRISIDFELILVAFNIPALSISRDTLYVRNNQRIILHVQICWPTFHGVL